MSVIPQKNTGDLWEYQRYGFFRCKLCGFQGCKRRHSRDGRTICPNYPGSDKVSTITKNGHCLVKDDEGRKGCYFCANCQQHYPAESVLTVSYNLSSCQYAVKPEEPKVITITKNGHEFAEGPPDYKSATTEGHTCRRCGNTYLTQYCRDKDYNLPECTGVRVLEHERHHYAEGILRSIARGLSGVNELDLEKSPLLRKVVMALENESLLERQSSYIYVPEKENPSGK